MSLNVVATLKEHFGEVKGPRQLGKVDHPLLNIIFITVCGVLCGADNWVAIEALLDMVGVPLALADRQDYECDRKRVCSQLDVNCLAKADAEMTLQEGCGLC